jgi:hypothetical protein
VEALLAAAVMIVVIAAALMILQHGWPTSSRHTGYGVWSGGTRGGEPGPGQQEDYEAAWRWDDSGKPGGDIPG